MLHKIQYHPLSPIVEKQLCLAGWTPDREVKEGHWLHWVREAHNQCGCHVFPEAIRILRQYGSLFIHSPYNSMRIDILPEKHFQFGDREIWLYKEWLLNEVLFPIGHIQDFDLSLAVSQRGRIFGFNPVSDDYLCGESFEDCLNNLLASYHSKNLVNLLEQELPRMTKDIDLEAETIFKALENP